MQRPSPWPNQQSVRRNLPLLRFCEQFLPDRTQSAIDTARSSLDSGQSASFCHRKNKSLAFECHFDLDLAWSVLRPEAGHSCFNFLLQKKNEDQANYWGGQNWQVHQFGTICEMELWNSLKLNRFYTFINHILMGEIKNKDHALTSSIRLFLSSIFHKIPFLLAKSHTLFLRNP